MTNKADCEVVEDLLPSYIDRLTHEKTTQLVQEHLENCISCQKSMRRCL
ncbi:zf-HC2 domain-containing protein [[Clostridium] spiroforme]|nr:zf-HC2 domain-containing protein [Thomasclavelia spiroformis]